MWGYLHSREQKDIELNGSSLSFHGLPMIIMLSHYHILIIALLDCFAINPLSGEEQW